MSIEVVAISLLCGLVLFLLFLRYLDSRISEVETKVDREVTDRISTIEEHEIQQDGRLHRQQKLIEGLKKEVKTLESDVGWDDSLKATQVLKKPDER